MSKDKEIISLDTKEAMAEAQRIINDPQEKGYTDLKELFKDLKK